MPKIELVKGTVYDLDKDKKYFIIFDRKTLSYEDLEDFNKVLSDQGFTTIMATIDGDPSTVQVIGQ